MADKAVGALSLLLHEHACKAGLLWRFMERCVAAVRGSDAEGGTAVGGGAAPHTLRLLRSLLDRLPRHALRSGWGGRHVATASPLATADTALLKLDASVRAARAASAAAAAVAEEDPVHSGGGASGGSSALETADDNDSGLLKLVVDSLVRYKQDIATRALPLRANVWETAFRGAVSHRAEVEEHLRFVRFVACSSSLALTLPLLRELAHELVGRAACAEERDCFFKWLASLAPGSVQRRGAVTEPITDATAELVFEHILCATAAASGSAGGADDIGASLAFYDAFEVYMRWCNLVRAAVDDSILPFVAMLVSTRRAKAQRRRHAAKSATIADIRAYTFTTLVDPRCVCFICLVLSFFSFFAHFFLRIALLHPDGAPPVSTRCGRSRSARHLKRWRSALSRFSPPCICA